MNVRYFPTKNKRPLIEGWREKATSDPAQLAAWQAHFGQELTHWGIPTGKDAGLLVLDVDVKHGGWETLNRSGFMLPPTPIQYTASGGAHIFFEYPQDGHRYGNSVNTQDGLDTRGEGGYVVLYNAGPNFQIPLIEAPEWVRGRSLRKVHTDPAAPTFLIHPSVGEAILASAVEAVLCAAQGESNNVLNTEAFKVGQAVIAGGLTRERAESALLEAALQRGKPRREAINTIESGLAGGSAHPLPAPWDPVPPQLDPVLENHIQENAPKRWTPLALTIADLQNTAKLRKPQLFRDWSTEDIHITTADGGTGKTTLKIYEAICLALGVPFLGFQCLQPGRTLFITGEDSAQKLAAMIGQCMRQMGLFNPGNEAKVQQVVESILIKKDADLCLITKDRSTGFLQPNPEAFHKVMEAVVDFKPKMIVFDPIASFWGSESSVNDMAKGIAKFTGELVERSAACVELINHMGKTSSQTKDLSQFAGRGGTGLPSHSRVSRTMRNVDAGEYQELTGTDLPENKSAILCQVNKFSDGSPLLMKPFIILRDGYLFTRIQLAENKAKEAEENTDGTERVMDFIRAERTQKRYPTADLIIAHFESSGNPIAMSKTKRILTILSYQGLGGVKIRLIDNPNDNGVPKAYVVTDMDNKEI